MAGIVVELPLVREALNTPPSLFGWQPTLLTVSCGYRLPYGTIAYKRDPNGLAQVWKRHLSGGE